MKRPARLSERYLAKSEKQNLIEQLMEFLNSELAALQASAKDAAGAATHEESRPENKYDTRGLEASYLAGAQAARAAELEAAIKQLSKMPTMDFKDEDPIGPSAVVEIEHQDNRTFYFLTQLGAGYTLQLGTKRVLSVTTSSPLGQALLSKTVGEVFTLKTAQGPKEYEIVSVY